MQKTGFRSYPAEVHKEDELSARVRRVRPHIRLKPLSFPLQGERRYWAMAGGLLVGITVVCVGVGVVLPALSGGSGTTPVIPTTTTGQIESDVATEPEVEDAVETTFSSEPITIEETSFASPDATEEDVSSLQTEPPEISESTETTVPPASTDTEDSDLTSTSPSDEPAESEPEPETTLPDLPAVSEGWIPVLSQDVSEADRGAGYIVGMAGNLPAGLPTGGLWKNGTPVVLVVNTHPYEGFSDGASLYDPATGGLAVTETIYDSDGVVAFASALTRSLRGKGITVIHLRVSVSEGVSAGEIYDRTESMIRYYCRLYPDIGLVLDLRRSAELTEGGEILRTAGCYGGEDCAQLRISVNGGKETSSLAWDLKTALALREALWNDDLSISRPVRVKSGQGLIADLSDVRVLTLEAGSAGNTYDEAERLIAPLSAAIAKILDES